MTRRAPQTVVLIATAFSLAACAIGGQRASSRVAPTLSWPVVTHEYVDLWLHGYALIMRDEVPVPVFRRGYRDSLDAVRRRDNVLTGLDANHVTLATLLAQNPEISNGQFLPLYFTSEDTMRLAINAFLRVNGVPAQAAPAERQPVALLASMYPTAQDREWLRVFTQSLGDESDHFYHQYWMAQQQQRHGVADAVDSLWNSLRPRFQRFLTNTHQTGGELVLSLVLGGEGRTLNALPEHTEMVVTMPPSRAEAADAIYGFVHEAVQTITNGAVTDNTTAAEQRTGEAANYSPLAAVRGGAMLLQRVAPEFVDGYMRFYLRQSGITPPAGNVEAAFVGAYQVPTAVVAAIDRQIGTALGGI